MDEEPTTAGEEVLRALERTVSHGSARLALRNELSLGNLSDVTYRDAKSPKTDSTRARGGSRLRRLKRRLWDAIAPRLLSATMLLLDRWLHKTWAPYAVAIGVIDFGAHRCMYGYAGKSDAVLVIGDRSWSGSAGSAVDGLRAGRASVEKPPWLFDLVRGVVEARELPPEEVAGRTLRRFSAVADLNRVAQAVDHHVALPSLGLKWLVDLRKIAVEVWVDDGGRIRRLRRTEGPDDAPTSVNTLDLSDFGIELPEDWSRLASLSP